MDFKWSERFSRLEAMLLSKSLSQPAPTFQPVKVTPVKPPPVSALDNTEPFFAPARSTDQLVSSQQQASDHPQPVDRPSATDQPATGSVVKPSTSTSGVEPTYRPSDSDMDTDSNSDAESIPVMLDSALSSSEDNQFAAPKQQPAGKTSVNLPTDNWLCHKMDRLNLTFVQSYPSRSSEAGGLQRDQFVKHGKSQGKWYGLHPSQDKPAGTVSFWHSEAAKLNST